MNRGILFLEIPLAMHAGAPSDIFYIKVFIVSSTEVEKSVHQVSASLLPDLMIATTAALSHNQ